MRTIFIILFSIVCSSSWADDNLQTTKAELNEVVVYRQGAEMKHSCNVALKKQTQYVEILNISNSVDLNSVQLSSDGGVTILGFVYSNTYYPEEQKTSAYKLLEDSLKKLDKEITRVQTSLKIYNYMLEVLNSNKEIKGTQTGLSVAELMKMIDYYKSKSTELYDNIGDLQEKQTKLANLKTKILQQMEEEQLKNTQKGGKLTVQIVCETPGNHKFNLTYLTTNAYWVPFYDIRTESTNEPFELISKAKVYQTSGIDWKQVHLKLSTGMPTQTGTAPVLQQWNLNYVYAMPMKARMSKQMAMNQMQPMSEVVVTAYGKKTDDEDGISEPPPPAPLSNYVEVQDNVLNVSYDISIPFDLSTDGKEQVATYQSQKINCGYKYYCVPKLNDDVFLIAEVPDWGQLNLLDGEANLFSENTFSGKTIISSASSQDTLQLTVGTDKRINVKREKLKEFSSTKFLSSNKLETFTYQITVKNNKKQDVEFMLKDQFPLSTNSDVVVALTDDGGASVNQEIGILTWKTNLKAGEQKKYRFQFTVKYPKDKRLNL